MRLLYIILSIYFLVLSGLPCLDMIEHDISMAKDLQSDQHSKNHSHKEDDDLCSPFCVCNCCGIQVLVYQSIISYDLETFSIIKTENKESLYKSVFYTNFYNNIWQPPKIG
ncbi:MULTISPECIES: DUF6660 family protein [Flavobacterium]|nr:MULTISPECIES: DUF6660 family protein [Flavobacterium]OXA76595.1 hypothetical protein B0A56_10245 [Flavobacterium columnare NBRC 100251 = ATCC 23463]MCH4830183.1 hypothetical protein [Flavobacterium columnare]MCH4832435.1 hypothetical protein [Flavobacterium columnare]OWP82288.1 hypothetical protein BWK63_01225 [Flavobacterium covae]OWP86321.1 hypothetical protein BWK60_09425 [Flavobacterium covae]